MMCTRLNNITVFNVLKTNQSNCVTCTRLNNITVFNVLKTNQSNCVTCTRLNIYLSLMY